MKKVLPLIFVLSFFSQLIANDLIVVNPYSRFFRKAYSLYPSVPKGMLEAVAYTQSRFYHIDNTTQPSCIGYPKTYGVMGLVLDGKNYFRNNLVKISQLSGYSEEAIIASPESSILSYAAAFSKLQENKTTYSKGFSRYNSILIELSELPVDSNVQNNFALNAHLYQIYWFLSNSEFQDAYGFPDHQINLRQIFGSNYTILSSDKIIVRGSRIENNEGEVYKLTSVNTTFSPDYPSALYTPAASCNYSSRAGTAISAVTIHDVEGSYAGCISWFQNCAASVSAHYVLRSSDGQVTQMVLEASKAWHVGSENPYTVGLEHEGYNNNASWYTNAMYNSSGALVKDICTDNSINPLRTYYGPGCSGTSQQCGLGSCTKVKGHQMYPNQTHNDPGPYWNWAKYYKIINNTYTLAATYTTSSGAFYDTGGSAANYSNDERKFWLFTKPGTTNITLSFSSFNVENGYDNLFIYNGGTPSSPLIGQYSGTVNPGPVTSVNDSILVEFRSDCATTNPGWIANYTMNGSVTPTSSDNIAPTTIATTTNVWQTAAFTTTLTDTDNSGGSGVEKGYYQVIDFNGTEWRANYTHGFFADNFDNAIHPEWTQKTGTWGITGNALEQSDEVSTAAANTNIYAALTQSLSNRYLYHFLAKFEGSGTSRRGGFHFFCDQPDSSNRNNSYFVWFRLDDQKVQIYKVVNNVFGAPKVDIPLTFNVSQWYDIKVIYDRITGKITVYFNNNVIASWTDTAPYSSGDYISFRSGNCKFSIDEIKVYRSRPATVNVTVGSGMNNDLRYQNPSPIQAAGKIKSICQDSAGNLSSIYYLDLNVDWTPPANITSINDGVATDINTINTTDSLRANWATSSDPNSGIVRYWYSIGTTPGNANIKSWTSNWASNAVTAHSLSLTQNTIYYFSVMAEDGAGLFSPIISSDGQKVDTTYFVGIKPNVVRANGITVYPNPFSKELKVNFENSVYKTAEIILTDILGREVYKTNLKDISSSYTHTISVNKDLSPGTYLLKLNLDNNSYYHKLIKD